MKLKLTGNGCIALFDLFGVGGVSTDAMRRAFLATDDTATAALNQADLASYWNTNDSSHNHGLATQLIRNANNIAYDAQGTVTIAQHATNKQVTRINDQKGYFGLHITNNTSEPITYRYYVDFFAYRSKNYLMAYAELDEPITVQPGESKIAKIEIDFTQLRG